MDFIFNFKVLPVLLVGWSQSGQRYIVLTVDEALYGKLMELKWAKEDYRDCLVVRLGGLHTALNYLKVIGQYMQSSGLLEVWTESDILGPKTAEQVLAVFSCCWDPPAFLIKHQLSGKYVRPLSTTVLNDDQNKLRVYTGSSDAEQFRFEQLEERWGYIKLIQSGWFVHTRGDSIHPAQSTYLLAHPDTHEGCKFAVDQQNDVIKHIGGKYVHPYHRDSAAPSEGDHIIVHSDQHLGMKWKFVSPINTNKEVFVYGDAQMNGTWEVINMALNSMAPQRMTVEYKVGKSKTQSTETNFKYKWELSGGISIEFFSGYVSQTLVFMLNTASTGTWSEEVTKTREMTVSPGHTVVTWQYVFTVTQDHHKGVYRSNILADTDSAPTHPQELDDAQYVLG